MKMETMLKDGLLILVWRNAKGWNPTSWTKLFLFFDAISTIKEGWKNSRQGCGGLSFK
jgi:hypothetical protein